MNDLIKLPFLFYCLTINIFVVSCSEKNPGLLLQENGKNTFFAQAKTDNSKYQGGYGSCYWHLRGKAFDNIRDLTKPKFFSPNRKIKTDYTYSVYSLPYFKKLKDKTLKASYSKQTFNIREGEFSFPEFQSCGKRQCLSLQTKERHCEHLKKHYLLVGTWLYKTYDPYGMGAIFTGKNQVKSFKKEIDVIQIFHGNAQNKKCGISEDFFLRFNNLFINSSKHKNLNGQDRVLSNMMRDLKHLPKRATADNKFYYFRNDDDDDAKKVNI